MKMSKEDNEEFDIFLDFITYFCTELKSGTSPEYALARSIQYFGKQSPKLLINALKTVVEGTQSFSAAWRSVIQNYSETRYQRVLELLGRFLEKSGQLGGERMLQVLKHIRMNRSLTKNRQNLIRAQRLKVFALSIVSSAVIGMIAGISPVISLAFSGLLTNQILELPLGIIVQIFLTLFLTVNISAYHLSYIVGRSSRILLVCSLAFLTSFAIMINLISTIL